jgi:hypothetical protein
MQSHTEAIVVDIVSTVVNIVVVEHTLIEELSHEISSYHTGRRNLRPDYFVFHNWGIQELLMLLEHWVGLLYACFDHSWYKMPSLLVPPHDMLYKFVSVVEIV